MIGAIAFFGLGIVLWVTVTCGRASALLAHIQSVDVRYMERLTVINTIGECVIGLSLLVSLAIMTQYDQTIDASVLMIAIVCGLLAIVDVVMAIVTRLSLSKYKIVAFKLMMLATMPIVGWVLLV